MTAAAEISHQHDQADTGTEPAPAPAPQAAPTPAPQPAAWHHTVARQAATVSSKLSPLARQAGDRVAAASPMTLLVSLLGVLAVLSVVASVSYDNSLGVASAVLFVPALSAAIGALAMRCALARQSAQTVREDARQEATEQRHLEHTLDYVDDKLTAALTQFGSDRHNDAVVAMFQAKAATELYRGAPARPASGPDRTDYTLADFLAPAALRSAEESERPAGLSLI